MRPPRLDDAGYGEGAGHVAVPAGHVTVGEAGREGGVLDLVAFGQVAYTLEDELALGRDDLGDPELGGFDWIMRVGSEEELESVHGRQ